MKQSIQHSFSTLFWSALLSTEVSQDLPQKVDVFLNQHCYECHDDDIQKGKLNLFDLDASFADRESIESWTHVYDRLKYDEMPPAKKKRPQTKAKKEFMTWLSKSLHHSDMQQREVVQRRLNRVEYQNTLNDLLSIQVDFKSILPEDQIHGGFDNNGSALALSTELMPRYLKAAELAIDTAIVKDKKPEAKTMTASALHQVERYFKDGIYGQDEDRIVLYTSSTTNYSKISTRSRRLPMDGKYRFSFEVKTQNSKEPLYFSVMASNFASVGMRTENLGYFQANDKKEKIVIEADLRKKEAIQFFAFGFPRYIKHAATKGVPGIGFSPVTIYGPIHDTWAPQSHQNLIGKVDLEKGQAKDAYSILERFMTKAFRRPVSKTEIDKVMALFQSAFDQGRSFEDSLKLSLVSVLCSPNFLYLVENKTSQKLSAFQFASRLSYFLWSSAPDEQLFQKAKSKEIFKANTLRTEVERMLQDTKAKRFIDNFTGQWLKLRDIDATTPDRKLYPGFDDFLKSSMVDESKSFFSHILYKNLSIHHFLDADYTMLNSRLAKHYGIDNIHGVDMKATPLPKDSVRGGVLTQAALLKVTANGATTSPVIRGVWLLENILGRHVPVPPPNIEGIEPDIREATTIREQLVKHREVTSCQACHQLIDPPGFALENFDPTGKFRSHYLQFFPHPKNPDWGQVRPSAEVDASGTFKDGRSFNNILQFKAWLLDHAHLFEACLTEKLLTYELGRAMGFSDRKDIQTILKTSPQNQQGFKDLLHSIVQSETFRKP